MAGKLPTLRGEKGRVEKQKGRNRDEDRDGEPLEIICESQSTDEKESIVKAPE